MTIFLALVGYLIASAIFIANIWHNGKENTRGIDEITKSMKVNLESMNVNLEAIKISLTEGLVEKTRVNTELEVLKKRLDRLENI